MRASIGRLDAAPARPNREQTEVLSQGHPFVTGAKHPPFLQERNDGVSEAIKPPGSDVRNEDESIADLVPDELLHLVGDGGRRSNERLAGAHLDHELADRKV